MARVIRYNKPYDGPTHYFVQFDSGAVRHIGFSEYKKLADDMCQFAVDEYVEIILNEDEITLHDGDISILLNLAMNVDKNGDSIRGAYDALFKAFANHRPPTAPYKNLILYNAGENMNSYDKDVFMWNSVEGICRVRFATYLDKVSASHEGEYKLAKLNISRCSGIQLADFKALKKMPFHCGDGDHSDKTYMLFRTLWYCATGEEMPL